MTIEHEQRNKPLKELEPGDIFYFDSEIYIKSDSSDIDEHTCTCVNLESGSLEIFTREVKVGVIEKAVLKIGGYYK